MIRHNTFDYVVIRTGERKWASASFAHPRDCNWRKLVEKADKAASAIEGEPCRVIVLNGNAR